jgi:hypothetical protein
MNEVNHQRVSQVLDVNTVTESETFVISRPVKKCIRRFRREHRIEIYWGSAVAGRMLRRDILITGPFPVPPFPPTSIPFPPVPPVPPADCEQHVFEQELGLKRMAVHRRCCRFCSARRGPSGVGARRPHRPRRRCGHDLLGYPIPLQKVEETRFNGQLFSPFRSPKTIVA